ncbi:helix-turn-helix domain-containing protein [Actinomadura sp. LOL_016]|uniref:helix-turn-helix domain-containing protein n=1 Tax=unclassified Actinomadura TaxID=2626254 RepID=UPI003A811C56
MSVRTKALCDTGHPHVHTPEVVSAEFLDGAVSPRTLRDKAARGDIAFTRVGRAIRFSDDDIAQLIRDGSQGPRPVRRDSRRRS